MSKSASRAADPVQCVDAAQAATVPQYLGLSSDQRTNRWRVTCPACGHRFEPQTTLSRYQGMTCPKPKCGKGMTADYNAEPPTVKLLDPEIVADQAATEKKECNG